MHQLSIALPRRGVVAHDLDTRVPPGGLTAVVGANGSGATTWLRHLADRPVPGARSRGGVSWRGRPLPGANARDPLLVADWALPPLDVATWLRGLTRDVTAAAKRLDLGPFLTTRISQLPLDVRARLHLATLSLAPASSLVLADPGTTAAAATHRHGIATALRARAAEGAVVLWAEHDLDLVWEYADHIIELSNGRICYDGDPTTWVPRSVPEPTLMTLARSHRLDLAACRSTSDARSEYRAKAYEPVVLPPCPQAPLGDTLHLTRHGLGEDLELTLTSRESLGVVVLDGRAEPIARRLITELRQATLVTSHLPDHATPAALAASWERRHQLPPGTVLAQLPEIRRDDPLRNHGYGDRAHFRAALVPEPRQALWLPHPQAGLDTRCARDLAAELLRGCAGPRIVTSRDTEFLVRACHRILVVSQGRAVALGSPQAVAPMLPDPPVIAQAIGSPHHTRLSELLAVAP